MSPPSDPTDSPFELDEATFARLEAAATEPDGDDAAMLEADGRALEALQIDALDADELLRFVRAKRPDWEPRVTAALHYRFPREMRVRSILASADVLDDAPELYARAIELLRERGREAGDAVKAALDACPEALKGRLTPRVDAVIHQATQRPPPEEAEAGRREPVVPRAVSMIRPRRRG